MVRSSVEETLNGLLDTEADAICGAQSYQASHGTASFSQGCRSAAATVASGWSKSNPNSCGSAPITAAEKILNT